MISYPLIALLLAGTTLHEPPPAAAVTQEVTALELRVPVQGLDEQKAPLVERSLRALVDESDPPEKLLSAVSVDAEAGQMQLTLAPGKTLRLSQVEKALASIRGKIERQRLHVRDAGFVVASKAEGDLGERIRRTLDEARLFEEVEVRAATDAPRYLVTARGGTDKASVAAVAKALQEVSPALMLADVTWTAPEPEETRRTPGRSR